MHPGELCLPDAMGVGEAREPEQLGRQGAAIAEKSAGAMERPRGLCSSSRGIYGTFPSPAGEIERATERGGAD